MNFQVECKRKLTVAPEWECNTPIPEAIGLGIVVCELIPETCPATGTKSRVIRSRPHSPSPMRYATPAHKTRSALYCAASSANPFPVRLCEGVHRNSSQSIQYLRGPPSTQAVAYDRLQKPGLNIEKRDRPVASSRARAHPGPAREEKVGGTCPGLDREAVVEGLDLALWRSSLLNL